jgi:hypothetical protein
MTRYPLQTVTLPLLVDARDPDKADGECAVFPSGSVLRLQKVRIQSPEKLRKWLNRNTQSSDYVSALKGLSQLRRAYESHDLTALLAAVDRTRPLVAALSLPPAFFRVKEDWTGEQVWDRARWRYTESMNYAVRNARWVSWWPFSREHEPTPGLYCPDMTTAVAVSLFVESLRVCPHCETPFVPSQDNIVYCKPEHGVAHRTARSRCNAKLARAQK